MPLRVLILGGTTEASALAKLVSPDSRLDAILSFAGRTANPAASPLPVRVGGFGGVDGLSAYLTCENIDLLIDATHPFAANISRNAIAAATAARIPLLAVERPPWPPAESDDWTEYDSIEAAIAGLPSTPQSVFSGLGRQAIAALSGAPQHRYVIRVVDASEPPADLPHATIIAARGPFRTEDDIALFTRHGIRHVLAKNAGGNATYSKIEAARQLGIKVHMVRRPAIGLRSIVTSVDEALAWIETHRHRRSARGV